jgi:hypothetical protein
MSTIDYSAVAIITIFTSFFAGLGSEFAKVVIGYVRKIRELHKLQKKPSG